MEVDYEKMGRVRSLMGDGGVDLLVCRNPENVLYLTGYWPLTGWSFALFPLDGEPVVIAPASEVDYALLGWVKDVRFYEVEGLHQVWDPYAKVVKVMEGLGLKAFNIGLELSFETMAANHVGGELNYAGNPTFKLIKDLFKGSNVLDATALLYDMRIVKTSMEVEKLKLANEVASIGLEEARKVIEEGVTEVDVASKAEAAIQARGVGYKGRVRLARAFSFVMSGVNSSKAWLPYNISSTRRLRRGDVVLLELNVYADGYWSDLTRTWSVGPPRPEHVNVFETILEAHEAVVKEAKDGAKASEIDKAARDVIRKRGYGGSYPHRLGHGVGVRIHEPPALHPASGDVLKKGMVHSIEPGIYLDGLWGMRVEDNVLVTEVGLKYLSKYDRSLEA